MSDIFVYWYLFPVSVVIATIAIASGIGGAVFFSPLFILVLKVDPYTAIGAGLITELFGFSSGLYGYVKRKLIDYKFGKNLLFFSIPSSLAGVFLSAYIPKNLLMNIFAIGIIFVGWQIYMSLKKERRERKELPTINDNQEFESRLVDKQGNVYQYSICDKPLARLFAFIGGLFFGMISVGLAELQQYQLMARCRIPPRIAVATTIFLVAVTVYAVAIVRIVLDIGRADYHSLILLGKIILFTAPGVVVGGQIGPHVQQIVNPDLMKMLIAILLVLVGLFLLWNLYF